MGFTSYVLENDEAFKNALKVAGKQIGDLRLPYTLIHMDFQKSEKSIFQLKGPGQYPKFKGPLIGDTWVPDAQGGRPDQRTREPGVTAYQYAKKKKYGHDYPLLFASGKLAGSLLSKGASGSILSITPLSLVFGTSIAYGVYHQSDEPRDKIPLRKFLFIGPEAPRFATSDQMGRLNRWLGYINDYIAKKLPQVGA